MNLGEVFLNLFLYFWVSYYSPIQKKIYVVSDRRFHMLRSPPILAGRRNRGKMKTETL